MSQHDPSPDPPALRLGQRRGPAPRGHRVRGERLAPGVLPSWRLTVVHRRGPGGRGGDPPARLVGRDRGRGGGGRGRPGRLPARPTLRPAGVQPDWVPVSFAQARGPGRLVRREVRRPGGDAARFTPVLRTLTPVVAGVGAMPRRRFTLYNLAGGIAWAAATVLAGFFLGGVPLVATHVELVVLSIVVLSLVPTAIAVLGGHRRKRREPRPSEQRPDPCAEEALRAAFAGGRHPGQASEPTPTERSPRSPGAGRSPGPER